LALNDQGFALIGLPPKKRQNDTEIGPRPLSVYKAAATAPPVPHAEAATATYISPRAADRGRAPLMSSPRIAAVTTENGMRTATHTVIGTEVR
jgi:hypothetical protein